MNILNYALKLNRDKLFSLFNKKKEVDTEINNIRNKISNSESFIFSGLIFLVFIRIILPIFDRTMDLKYTTIILLAPMVFLGMSSIFKNKYIKYKEKVLGLKHTNQAIYHYLGNKSNHPNLFNYLNSLIIEYPQIYNANYIRDIKLSLIDKNYENIIKSLESTLLNLPYDLKEQLEKNTLQHYEKELNIKSIVLKNKEVEIEKEYQSML